MKLIDYIKSNRRGRNANRLERDAMEDPFLSDAIEGYDSVYGNHTDELARLEQLVAKRSMRRRSRPRRQFVAWGLAAAAVMLAAGALFYFLPSNTEPEMVLALADIERTDTISERETVSYKEVTGSNEADFAAEEKSASITVSEMAAAPAKPEADKQVLSVVQKTDIEFADSDELSVLECVSDESFIYFDEDMDLGGVEMAENVAYESADTVAEHKELSAEEISHEVKKASRSSEQVPQVMLSAAAKMEPDTVTNEVFNKFVSENRKQITDASGHRITGKVWVEFTVNSKGVPSAIRITSGFSREVNDEVIDMLVRGPKWTPTDGKRIITVVEYR